MMKVVTRYEMGLREQGYSEEQIAQKLRETDEMIERLNRSDGLPPGGACPRHGKTVDPVVGGCEECLAEIGDFDVVLGTREDKAFETVDKLEF